MIVSRDKYELPLVVSESIADIARTMHLNKESLRSMFSKAKNPEYKQANKLQNYITLYVDDDDMAERYCLNK